MEEKRIAFIASVKEREEQLKTVIDSIYDKVDVIHLELNWYNVIPDWVCNKVKIQAHLEPENENAHDAIWIYLDAENEVLKIQNSNLQPIADFNGSQYGSYYFILDDDIIYPADYFEKLIEKIEIYNRRAVITVHGALIVQPIKSYFDCRNTCHFAAELHDDHYVDMAGCGTIAFHSSTVKPALQNFPFVFCRDLWFSILCKKKNVPIIAIERPYRWLDLLETTGDTVYDATRNNKDLLRMKDRILKEVLAPLLFCNNSNKYCLITDYDFDELLLSKTLSTLNEVSNCNKIVFSNKVKDYSQLTPKRFDAFTQYVIPEEVEIGRAGSKVITHYRFIKGLKDNSKIISADADLYFLKDPFIAFEQDFDIAVTTRDDKNYHYPINQGIVMFRVNNGVRNFLDFLMEQIFDRTWPELINWQKKFNHTGNDWCVGQDEMCVAWLCKDEILERFGVKIIDIGSYWNYCPHADGAYIREGKDKLMDAYNKKNVAVLHLKSRLKELLQDGLLK